MATRRLPFHLLQQDVNEDAILFPGLLHFTLNPYLLMQGNIKYDFLSLWYDSTWVLTPVSWQTRYQLGQLAIITTDLDFHLFVSELRNWPRVTSFHDEGIGLMHSQQLSENIKEINEVCSGLFLCLMAYKP